MTVAHWVQKSCLTKEREKRRGIARVTSRAEGIQIEERSMTLEICIAINNEAGVRSPSYRGHGNSNERYKRSQCVQLVPAVYTRLLYAVLALDTVDTRVSCVS